MIAYTATDIRATLLNATLSGTNVSIQLSSQFLALNGSEFVVNGISLVLVGAPGRTTIDAQRLSRVFRVSNGRLDLRDVDIVNGVEVCCLVIQLNCVLSFVLMLQ